MSLQWRRYLCEHKQNPPGSLSWKPVLQAEHVCCLSGLFRSFESSNKSQSDPKWKKKLQGNFRHQTLTTVLPLTKATTIQDRRELPAHALLTRLAPASSKSSASSCWCYCSFCSGAFWVTNQPGLPAQVAGRSFRWRLPPLLNRMFRFRLRR